MSISTARDAKRCDTMGFLDEIRKKNKLAKSLVSNGLAPHFDVAVKMVEARMRHESGAQDPIGDARESLAKGLPSTNLNDLRYVAQHEIPVMTLDEQRTASIKAMGAGQTQSERKTSLSMTSPASAEAAADTARQHQGGQVPQGLSSAEIEKVLSENTRFITEQLIEFKTQIASIAATVELLQKDLAGVKQQMQRRVPPVPDAPAFSAGDAGPVQTKEQEAKEEAKRQHPRSPSGKDFKPEDVSIEKMFNYSNKKFD